MWGAIASGIMTGVSSLVSDSFIATQAGLQERMAKVGAKMAEGAFRRRAGYRNIEFAQNKWNIEDRARELAGRQNAITGASGFDISTGEQRIDFDTAYRAYKKTEGLSTTEAIEFFEDEMSTINDILQYNYQAYVARAQKKQHSGFASFGKALALGIGDALGKWTPQGKKDKVSDNVYGRNEYKPSLKDMPTVDSSKSFYTDVFGEYKGNKQSALFNSLTKQYGWGKSASYWGGK